MGDKKTNRKGRSVDLLNALILIVALPIAAAFLDAFAAQEAFDGSLLTLMCLGGSLAYSMIALWLIQPLKNASTAEATYAFLKTHLPAVLLLRIGMVLDNALC